MGKEKSKRPGRRPMPKAKTHQVSIRCPEGEHALIEAAAAVIGQEFGTFVRTVAVSASRAVVAPLENGIVDINMRGEA